MLPEASFCWSPLIGLGLVPREVEGEGRQLLGLDLQDKGVVGCDRNPRIERLEGIDRGLGEPWPNIGLGVSCTATEPPASDPSIITSNHVRSFRELLCSRTIDKDVA